MRLPHHPFLAAAIASTVVALSACGGSNDDRGARPSAKATARPAGSMSTAQYSEEAATLKTAVDDARSRYFHAARDAIKQRARGVRAAYADAAERLAAVEPPKPAAPLHTQLLTLWRKRASQLARLLAAKPYPASRVSDLLYSTDADNSLYNDIYTLPQ